MDNRVWLNNLYDYYKDLLTEKQQLYFEDYYFDNLSLTEIAENNNVSRNAVHKQLKETLEKLENYEDKLKLYDKKQKINKILDKVDKRIKEEIMNLI